MNKKLLEVGDVLIQENSSGDIYKHTISRVTATLAIVIKNDGRELRFKREISNDGRLIVIPRENIWWSSIYRYATQDLLNVYNKKILQKQLIKKLDEFKKNIDKCSSEDLEGLCNYIKNIELKSKGE